LVVLYVLIISFVKVDVFPQAIHTETDNVRKVAKRLICIKYMYIGLQIYTRHTPY